MIEWIACKDQMPTERKEYLLYSEASGQVAGPFPWVPDKDGKNGMWIDLFATPEAGECYGPPTVSHYAVWNGPAS